MTVKDKTAEQISLLADNMKLSAFSEYKELIDPTISFDENLLRILVEQNARREFSKMTKNIKQACLPKEKTFISFQTGTDILPHVSRDMINEIRSCSFIDDKFDIIAIGPPGHGKTHLAIATGYEATRKGYKVLFKQTSQLLLEMEEAKSDQKLTEYFKKIEKVQLLILDEFGYTPYNQFQSGYLFQIISQRYENLSTFYTTNYEFSKWGKFIDDKVALNAVIDRAAHRSKIMNMSGPTSFRLKDAFSKKKPKK